MENQKVVSDIEILSDAINTIDSMQIPVSLSQSVGIQLWRVNGNLKALYDAAVEEHKKRSAASSEPEIQILSEDEVPVEVKEAEVTVE